MQNAKYTMNNAKYREINSNVDLQFCICSFCILHNLNSLLLHDLCATA
jgi:hypothetical protein